MEQTIYLLINKETREPILENGSFICAGGERYEQSVAEGHLLALDADEEVVKATITWN